ncbi:MAG: hypothetical protein NVSMB18_07590 [Acetobacteraceae bacterium]
MDLDLATGLAEAHVLDRLIGQERRLELSLAGQIERCAPTQQFQDRDRQGEVGGHAEQRRRGRVADDYVARGVEPQQAGRRARNHSCGKRKAWGCRKRKAWGYRKREAWGA